ncbi:MAG: sigma-54 dependent transcriptional regulator [Planctomycetota bacterium]|nr:sigma-54 dependent transcriptional regulator [Planctomycetota bacterium]
MAAHLLIADDDAGVRAGLAAICRAAGHRISEAADGGEALERARAEAPDLVLLDLCMPVRTGLDVLPDLLGLDHPPAVVILTGHADVPTAVRAMQLGATNLLQKPIEPQVLQDVVARVLESRSVRVERDRLRDELARLRSGPIIGRSPSIRRVIEHVDRVAATPRSTALVSGESGVGKELVARAIHERSARAEGPFVAVNCAAISEGLLEAELFGYEPGAFTGGDPKGRGGLIAAADGGTLLLDEVGEMDPALQAKLLRVLQERTLRKVGGTLDLPMDVRIVAATNRDLATMVDEGGFREDLYYRLNVLSIHVPALRERAEDVAPIATHFLARFAEELGRDFTGFSEAAMDTLQRHPWPGNIRELKNAVERAAIMAEEGLIRPEHLVLPRREAPAAPRVGSSLPLEGWSLKGMEEHLIRRALVEFAGNRSQVARELGINRTTLYNKLRSYGIEAG